MASLNVKHDVILNITNDNIEGTYENLVKELDEVLSDIKDNGRLSYAFPPFIYSGVIRCIVNMCLSFLYSSRRLRGKWCSFNKDWHQRWHQRWVFSSLIVLGPKKNSELFYILLLMSFVILLNCIFYTQKNLIFKYWVNYWNIWNAF